MLYQQKQSQNKPAMLSTFCGASDGPHRKKEDKVVPDMVDLFNQNMGGVDSLIKLCTHMHLNESQNHGQSKRCIQPSYIPSNEFLHTL